MLAADSGLTLARTDDQSAIDALRGDVERWRALTFAALDVARAITQQLAEREATIAQLREELRERMNG